MMRLTQATSTSCSTFASFFFPFFSRVWDAAWDKDRTSRNLTPPLPQPLAALWSRYDTAGMRHIYDSLIKGSAIRCHLWSTAFLILLSLIWKYFNTCRVASCSFKPSFEGPQTCGLEIYATTDASARLHCIKRFYTSANLQIKSPRQSRISTTEISCCGWKTMAQIINWSSVQRAIEGSSRVLPMKTIDVRLW